jgi:sporulation protein YlmC with PRC-barrel domain
MKAPVLLSTLAALAAASFPALRAQTPAFPTNSTWNSTATNAATASSSLQTTSATTDAFALSKLAGKPVRGANQEEFGNVADFLIDTQSGKIAFAVVPSGRGASGETFRLVPIAAVDANGGQDAFTLRITRAQWDQAGTMTEHELQGRITLSADQVQRAARQFAISGQDNAGAMSNLTRATALRGQPLRSGNDQVGTIDDVLIDVARQTAAAVVKPASNANGQGFIVPFAQLQFSNEGAITTTLGRNEFQAAQTLSPTGYASGSMQDQAAVSAVQQAIANNRALGGLGVQVVPENRLVLRGSVQTQQQRADIERTAAQAAPGVRIDNEITVRGW